MHECKISWSFRETTYKVENEWDPTQKGCSGDMACTYL